jgi:ABC-type sugar transport system ATPase subunit
MWSAAASEGNMSERLLEMRGISKSYPGVQALKQVNLSADVGEIVCLLGENGAGKSTLVKILAGAQSPDSGEILINGVSVRFKSTREAAARGISIVFQEFNLCPNLSAMENLFLGNEVRGRLGLLSDRQMRQKARESFSRLRTEIDPDALVRNLGVAQQQIIEVAKALLQNPRILIMDEPTATLADKEIQILFSIMRELKERGLAIIFISHKLNEVLAITDRVVCLRDGRNSGEIQSKLADSDKLVSMMVGRDLGRMYASRQSKPSTEVVLEVRDFSRAPRVNHVSFQLRRGEVLGLAGLIGAGRTELARLIMGADKKTAGAIELNGQPVEIRHPTDAVAYRIGYVSEDRKRLGLVLGMTVRENCTMTVHPRVTNRFGLLSRRAENELTDSYISRLQMKVSSREQVTRNLSGGNQQKVALAKWLAIQPEVLILDEPTRGIDVGAKAEVHQIIARLADQGVSILLISSDLPEVLHLADRVIVMHQGRLTADLPRELATEEAVMKAAVS